MIPLVVDEPSSAQPVIRVTAMPADANPHGDIFGAWLMGQMDQAAGSVASRRCGGRAVTTAVEAWRRARRSDECYRVTRARMTIVALGGDRQPGRVPPLACQPRPASTRVDAE